MSFFEDASLVLIPSGIKNQKIYSIKPTDGTGDLTFTRASNATRVASNGLIEKVRTNLYPRGSALLATGWTSVGATLTAGQTDPNGGTTALRVQLAAAQAPYAYILQSFTGSAATYARSAYIKAASAQSIRIVDPHSGAGTTVNLTTDWQRFTAVGAGIAPNFGIQFDNNNDAAAKDFTIAFVQIEEGDIATDYIATTSAAVSVGPVSGLPRLDYLGSTCGKLLLEPQRTNYQPNSEDFDNWYAPNDGVTLSENTSDTLDPSGYNGATKVTTTGGNQRIYDIVSIPAGSSTYSIFVKAGTGNLFTLFTSNAAFAVQFNLSTQSVTATIGSGTITSYGNGWYRCTATGTTPSGDVIQLLFPNSVGQTTYIWGAQWEAGAYATSYIPTTSAAVTRLADDCVKTSATSIIGQTEGVVFFEWEYQNTGSSGGNIPLSLDGGTGELLYFWVQTNGTYFADIYDGSVSQASITGSMGSFGTKKIAIAYKSNDFALYINGVLAGTDTSGSVPTLNRLYVGRYLASTYEIASGIKQVLLFKTRLTNAQLAELTTL